MDSIAAITPPEGFTRRHLRRVSEQKSLVVFFGMSTSIVIGVAFQSFIASRLGTGGVADVFYLGVTVPTLVATALLGSAPNALIRFAVDEPNLLRLERNSAAARLMTFGVGASVLMALFGGGEILSPLPLLAAHERPEIGEFLLITSPVPVLALLAALGSVRALAHHRFVVATFGGAVNGVGLLVATLVLSSSKLGIPQLALAVDCGYVAQLALVWRSLRSLEDRADSLAPIRSLQGAPVAAFAMLLFASSLYKSQPLVERVTGSILGSGVPAALGYADKVTSGLIQLATFGFALAALPFLSRQLSEGGGGRAVARLSSALEATCASTAGVVAFGLISSGALVRALYERGTFGASAAHVTHALILCALPSVACAAVAAPLVALEYAAGNVRAVVLIGLTGFVSGTLATAGLAFAIGYRGIVLGTAVGYVATLAIFARRTAGVLPGWSWRVFVSRTGPRIVVVILGTAVVSFLASVVRPPAGPLLEVVVLGIRLGLALASALGVLMLLRSRRAPLQAASPAVMGEVRE